MINHEERVQNWRIDTWLRSKGIDRRTIEHHPYCGDIELLLQFRNEFDAELKKDLKSMVIWGTLWNVSFCKQKPIKAKYWLKLEQIHARCMNQRRFLEHQRQLIKALRGTSQDENKGLNMTANRPDHPGVKHMKRDQVGGRGMLDTLPGQ